MLTFKRVFMYLQALAIALEFVISDKTVDLFLIFGVLKALFRFIKYHKAQTLFKVTIIK